MKQVFGASMFALMLLGGVVATAYAQSNESSIGSDQVHEKSIRALYDRFEDAWNRHDTKALGAMWAIDGDHQEPDGRMVKGRAEVEALLAKQHATVFAKTEITLKIKDVWFMTADVALVDGFYSVNGIRDPKGNELPTRSGHLTAILMRERGEWAIAASRLMIPAGLPWK